MATFTATPAFLGTPDFKIIDIDPIQVAQGLQDYLKRGSQLTGVSLDEIDRSVYELPVNVQRADLATLISKGMKVFDAIVWLTAGRPESHPLQVTAAKTVDNIPNLLDIARAIFYNYFFLLTQARYPVRVAGEGQPAVANFLRVVMGMDQNQEHYVNMVCSFAPQKFNPAWVKHVSFENFGQEALSRFGLGVAGYRLFGPFKVYSVRTDLPAELQNACQFARNVAMAPPSWNVHPLTRNPEVLTQRGNLNKNLGNLILEAFTREQIDEMVAAKMLYAMPQREPNYQNYKTWTAADTISGNAAIFRQ